jgi:hypothetical protein
MLLVAAAAIRCFAVMAKDDASDPPFQRPLRL